MAWLGISWNYSELGIRSQSSNGAFPAFTFFLFCEKESLWPGSKGIARKEHRPAHFGFRIADFGFWGFLFQSAFRNQQFAISEARPTTVRQPAFPIRFSLASFFNLTL
jgi:hypothetical protein